MQKYALLLFVCSLLMCVLVFLLLRGPESLVVKPNDTTKQWKKTSPDGDLIFIGDSREVLHKQMTNDEADIALSKFLSRHHVACEKSVRLGNVLDGGWDICVAGPFRPQKPCLVYSFGINNDFSFDDAVGTTFGCTVRSFDPSMSTKDYQRNANVGFYQIGIGGKDTTNSKGWKIRTLSSLVSQFNESNTVIDYLKMDVESSEWSSIEAMLQVGILSRIKQIGMEVHIEGVTDKDILYERYELLRRLEAAGFRRWYFANNYYNIKFTKNGFRSCCYEMVYVNMNFLTDSNLSVAKKLS